MGRGVETKLKALDGERDNVAYGIVGIVGALWQVGALDSADICEANRESLANALSNYCRLCIEIKDELDKIS